MKTYWDLTDKERVAISDDDLKKYYDIELMIKGLVMPIMPKKENIINPMEYIVKRKMYRVESIYFENIESAEEFIFLSPQREGYDYSVGYDYKFTEPIKGIVETVFVCDVEDIRRIKKELVEYETKKKQYNNDMEEYDDAIKEIDNVLADMREDRERVFLLDNKYKTITRTYDKFLELSDNNPEIAMNFLLQRYTEEEIKDAIEWGE